MGKPALCLVAITLLLALHPTPAPAQTFDSCYQPSNLLFFQDVVELVSWDQDAQRGCWVLRLRLRGAGSPQGHAMICNGNACSPQLLLTERIYWQKASPISRNVWRVTWEDNGSCTDVSFCVEPVDPNQPMLVDFAAYFEEGYFQSPQPTWRPRWSQGYVDLSALFDRTKNHCQGDGAPRTGGSICLED